MGEDEGVNSSWEHCAGPREGCGWARGSEGVSGVGQTAETLCGQGDTG